MSPRVGSDPLSPLPYFPLYASDWLGSNTRARLTAEQRGAFWDLICHAWNTPDGTLPLDHQVLASFSGLGARWARVGPAIIELAFRKRGDRIYNPRMMQVRASVLEKQRAAQRAGRKSGAARAKRRKQASNGRSTDGGTKGATESNLPDLDPDPDPDLQDQDQRPRGRPMPEPVENGKGKKLLKAIVWQEVKADPAQPYVELLQRVKDKAAATGIDYVALADYLATEFEAAMNAQAAGVH